MSCSSGSTTSPDEAVWCQEQSSTGGGSGVEKCPSGELSKQEFVLAAPDAFRFPEISFLAISQQKVNGETVIWLGNDGRTAEIAAFALESGRRLRTVSLGSTPGLDADRDWESIALAPCGPDSLKRCLYIGDTGNNAARQSSGSSGRSRQQILKLEEPFVDGRNEPINVMVMNYDFKHASSPTSRADCEGLFVDETGDEAGGEPGDVYIVTKWDTKDVDKTRLFKFPVAHQAPGTSYSVQAVAGPAVLRDQYNWDRADMTLGGGLISIGNYAATWFWTRARTQTVAQALSVPPCPKTIRANNGPGQAQFEATGFYPDGRRLAEVSECADVKKCRPKVFSITFSS